VETRRDILESNSARSTPLLGLTGGGCPPLDGLITHRVDKIRLFVARVQPANGNYEIPNAAGCKIESSKLRTTEIVADFAR
jgi:hypothetical protein